MRDSKIIQESLGYIERNIKAKISVRELAAMAGYSERQFGSLFLRATGLPPYGYMLKRRLFHAIVEICAGRAAVDAAAEYGFGSYAGLYKTFVRGYGCSPRLFFALYGRQIPKEGEEKMAFAETELRAVIANWEI
ncbi:MAG: AraC family transcriptional regulator, partial [Christensenellaceae bacterium]|nr:AraC family transcriptional regulator [Christensenellaceae bacterium]